MRKNLKKKNYILGIGAIVIFLLAFSIYVMRWSNAKFVMGDTITISASACYCNVGKPQDITFEDSTFNTTITVKNNDGTNYMDKDLEYTISCGNEKFDISVEEGELERIIAGGAKKSDVVSLTLILKEEEEIEEDEIIDIVFTITSPYNDEKIVLLDYFKEEIPPIVYSTESWTNQDVTATLTLDGVTITNNGGSNEYVFSQNGAFTFEYEDAMRKCQNRNSKCDMDR